MNVDYLLACAFTRKVNSESCVSYPVGRERNDIFDQAACIRARTAAEHNISVTKAVMRSAHRLGYVEVNDYNYSR